jgi:kinesin family protein 4/21/27
VIDKVLQTGGLLKDYVTRIQELECELLQIQNSRFPSIQSSRPISSHSSDSFGDSASGLDFETTHVDRRVFLPPGKISVVPVCF